MPAVTFSRARLMADERKSTPTTAPSSTETAKPRAPLYR